MGDSLDIPKILPRGKGITLDPFNYLTPLYSPDLVPADYKVDQFKYYMLRVKDDDILIDL